MHRSSQHHFGTNPTPPVLPAGPPAPPAPKPGMPQSRLIGGSGRGDWAAVSPSPGPGPMSGPMPTPPSFHRGPDAPRWTSPSGGFGDPRGDFRGSPGDFRGGPGGWGGGGPGGFRSFGRDGPPPPHGGRGAPWGHPHGGGGRGMGRGGPGMGGAWRAGRGWMLGEIRWQAQDHGWCWQMSVLTGRISTGSLCCAQGRLRRRRHGARRGVSTGRLTASDGDVDGDERRLNRQCACAW